MNFFQSFTSSTLKVTDKKSPLPVVYVYKAFNKQIVIDFDKKTILPGIGPIIGIFNSTLRSGQPFVVLNGGEYPPDFIASDTNEMKVEIYQTLDIEAKVQVVDMDCNSEVRGHGAIYWLIGCNDLCIWQISNPDTKYGTFHLQLSQFNLNDTTDELSMTESYTGTSIFKLKGIKLSEEIS